MNQPLKINLTEELLELENFIIYLSMIDILVRLSLSLNKTPKPFWSFTFYLIKPSLSFDHFR